MSRRLPSPPPILPGFSFSHILGSGGFADVFLYEQNMPRRQVAVKVMLKPLIDDGVRQMFQAEANLMAQLSSHPAILTVYQAGVAADGRPYLVMELCSPALNDRYRRERIPVDEALRIAIRIGSALETVHRAGVLHRDIKPSNILLTAYGYPVLSDFGIAATFRAARDEDAVGLSIPWSAPEVLVDETPGSVASDVWSYAATVYSLIAGRSPFEVPGGDNGPAALMGRIARTDPAPIDRADVPARLESALRRAMDKNPSRRPPSIFALVRELQAVEAEMGFPVTGLELAVENWASTAPSDLDERTELRPVTSVASASRADRRRRTREASGRESLPLAPATDSRRTENTSDPARARRVGAVALVATVATLAIGLGLAAIAIALSAAGAGIPTVSNVTSASDGGVLEFTWDDPGLDASDRYQIRVEGGETSFQTGTRFIVDADPGERVCITVAVNRAGASGAASAPACATAPGG